MTSRVARSRDCEPLPRLKDLMLTLSRRGSRAFPFAFKDTLFPGCVERIKMSVAVTCHHQMSMGGTSIFLDHWHKFRSNHGSFYIDRYLRIPLQPKLQNANIPMIL